jgi:hypothetical protein
VVVVVVVVGATIVVEVVTAGAVVVVTTAGAGANATGAATIAKVIVAVAVPAVVPLAVIVTVAVEAVVGVPDTTPVDELNNNPAGNVPLVTAYEIAPVKLLAVNAVEAEMAEFSVPAIVCVAGKTSGGRFALTVLAPTGLIGPSEAAIITDPLLARPI